MVRPVLRTGIHLGEKVEACPGLGIGVRPGLRVGFRPGPGVGACPGLEVSDDRESSP